MTQNPPLTPEQRADLVAYLDGELDDITTQEMEHLLTVSSEARHEVDMLTRTFSLLDSLPRPTASEEFTRKTFSTLKTESAKESWTERPWYRHARRGLVAVSWLVGLLVAVCTAYYAANRAAPAADRALIRELPVIENLDEYSDIGGIDELRELAKHGVFDEDETKTQR